MRVTLWDNRARKPKTRFISAVAAPESQFDMPAQPSGAQLKDEGPIGGMENALSDEYFELSVAKSV